IDELPPGRQVVKTKLLEPDQREKAYTFIRNRIADEGGQIFIIYPLIEESEALEAKAATTEYEKLCQEIFPEMKLGLLHGRMPPEEKENVMRRFRDGEFNILVSTSVIEVGIDIPNATVMLIESADRFGLSQLHQFRGRVGRGATQSYCLLITDKKLSPEIKNRLSLIERIHDGFLLAEEDLKLRGPGEVFGTTQSGLPNLRVARLSDFHLMELARHEALLLFQDNPNIKKAEQALLQDKLSQIWCNNTEWS
ncbi:MAG: helicase-related protein, partial [Chloroflexota bacterium]|nr:helicase-related protein [Chloroflexota bacterium]